MHKKDFKDNQVHVIDILIFSYSISAGHILIATSDGGTRSPLQVYKVTLSWKEGMENFQSFDVRPYDWYK